MEGPAVIGHTKVISVHHVRRVARSRERTLQAALDFGGPDAVRRFGVQTDLATAAGWPVWARGVRVEKAGLFQWAVVATEGRGR